MATIEIVDNDWNSCQVMARLLDGAGYSVTFSLNSCEALSLMHRARPDLLILDVNMPELNGLELLRILKCDLALRNVPVIMCSAVPDPEVQTQALQLGALDYIVKGTDYQSLLQRVAQQLRPPSTPPDATQLPA